MRFSISENEYLDFRNRISGKENVDWTVDMILSDGTVHPQKGKINLANRQIDPSTGTLTLEATFPNPEEIVRPGQFAKVRFTTEIRKGAMLIPLRAVTELQGTYQVYVVNKENKIEARMVEAGQRYGEYWIINSGLESTDKVALIGNAAIKVNSVSNTCTGQGRFYKNLNSIAMSEFFIRRPIVAMVISIIIVIVGLVAMKSLPISQYPEITPPEVLVTTTFQGANALNVEQAVATPIEQKVNGVEEMLYMKSVNASDGSLSLRIAFEVGTDLDNANMLTVNRVNQADAILPTEVKQYGVVTKKALPFPLLIVSLQSPNGSYDNNFLSNYANINVVDVISRISGGR